MSGYHGFYATYAPQSSAIGVSYERTGRRFLTDNDSTVGISKRVDSARAYCWHGADDTVFDDLATSTFPKVRKNSQNAFSFVHSTKSLPRSPQ